VLPIRAHPLCMSRNPWLHPARWDDNKYKTAICKFWVRGECLRGSRCRYAHGSAEHRKGPGRAQGASAGEAWNDRWDPQAEGQEQPEGEVGEAWAETCEPPKEPAREAQPEEPEGLEAQPEEPEVLQVQPEEPKLPEAQPEVLELPEFFDGPEVQEPKGNLELPEADYDFSCPSLASEQVDMDDDLTEAPSEVEPDETILWRTGGHGSRSSNCPPRSKAKPVSASTGGETVPSAYAPWSKSKSRPPGPWAKSGPKPKPTPVRAACTLIARIGFSLRTEIYLSDYRTALDHLWVEDVDIAVLIRCTTYSFLRPGETPVHDAQEVVICVEWENVGRSSDERLAFYHHLRHAFNELEKMQGHKLFYCKRGFHRSAAVLSMWLLYKYRYETPQEVMAKLCYLRPGVEFFEKGGKYPPLKQVVLGWAEYLRRPLVGPEDL